MTAATWMFLGQPCASVPAWPTRPPGLHLELKSQWLLRRCLAQAQAQTGTGIGRWTLGMASSSSHCVCPTALRTAKVVKASPGLELPASHPGPRWARLGLAPGLAKDPKPGRKPQHWNHASLALLLIRPLTCCFTARLAPSALARLPALPRACQDRCVHLPACLLLLLGWPSLADKSFGSSDLTSSRSSTLTRALLLADNRLH